MLTFAGIKKKFVCFQLVDFLENQLVGKHVDRVRQLSGYLTNLVPMVGEPQGMDLALYLFDQSLA